MPVQLSQNLKKKQILLDTSGNQYASMADLKAHNPIQNGKNYTNNPSEEEENFNNRTENDKGVVRPEGNTENGKWGNAEKTTNEQIRLAILNSDLSDKDKVFMTMLLKDKSKEEAIMAILTAPLKDKQKVTLMQTIW